MSRCSTIQKGRSVGMCPTSLVDCPLLLLLFLLVGKLVRTAGAALGTAIVAVVQTL
jgi:hypothetical protein